MLSVSVLLKRCLWLVTQLFDFEAMTTASPDRFSKTVKSWMNLKRYSFECFEYHYYECSYKPLTLSSFSLCN